MQLFVYDYMSPEKYKSIQQVVTGEGRGSWKGKREKKEEGKKKMRDIHEKTICRRQLHVKLHMCESIRINTEA